MHIGSCSFLSCSQEDHDGKLFSDYVYYILYGVHVYIMSEHEVKGNIQQCRFEIIDLRADTILFLISHLHSEYDLHIPCTCSQPNLHASGSTKTARHMYMY